MRRLGAYACSAAGNRSIVVSSGGSAVLTDVASGRQVPLELGIERLHQASFSRDGRLLAACAGDAVVIWDAELLLSGGDARPATRIPLRFEPRSLAFSPDNRRLAVGGDQRQSVSLFDTESRQEVLTLASGAQRFIQTRFSNDGNTIASGTFGGELYLWRAPTLAEIDAAEATPGGW